MIPATGQPADRSPASRRPTTTTFTRAASCVLALAAISATAVTPARGAELLRAGDSVKVAALLGRGDYEASGVAVKGDAYYVVFDSLEAVARLPAPLSPGSPGNALVGPEGEDGFEGIGYDPRDDRFYIVTETVEDDGELRSEVTVLDGELRVLGSSPLDFSFESENKGFEGIALVRRPGELYLLALCEGNKCKKGDAGRKGGEGRIQVFRREESEWDHVDTIKLPESVEFADYSGLDVRENAIAVTSQEDSRLWIGRLESSGSGADIDFKIGGDGKQFRFDEDEMLHCNVEGIAFVRADTLVAVSDRRKKDDQPRRCKQKDQSIHIFTVP